MQLEIGPKLLGQYPKVNPKNAGGILMGSSLRAPDRGRSRTPARGNDGTQGLAATMELRT